jgi:hypothetical protein
MKEQSRSIEYGVETMGKGQFRQPIKSVEVRHHHHALLIGKKLGLTVSECNI